MIDAETRTRLEVFVDEGRQNMRTLMDLVTGDPEADPLEVLPPPAKVRRDDPGLPHLDVGELVQLREIASWFDIGGDKNVIHPAEVVLIEGGLVWKILAELQLLRRGPHSIVLAGSDLRIINREDELAFIREHFDVDATGWTEFELIRFLAEQHVGFRAGPENDLAFGYDAVRDCLFLQAIMGQLTQIGTIGTADVLLLRVDPAGEKPNGDPFYPNSAALMGFLSNVLTARDNTTSKVGLITSSTYASRAFSTLAAGLRSDREFTVSMYGRIVLAAVQQKPAPEPTAINQIPSELHLIWKALLELEAELARLRS